MRPRPSSGAPLLALQVYRFVAAALVLVHHTGYDADLLAARTGRPPLALDRLFDWTFGVHLFFVLSGFIMVHAERDFGRAGAGRRFMVRRIVRVVPLYWLLTTALLIGAAVAPGLLNTPVQGWLNVLGSYLFVPVMRATGDSHPVLGQGWTLDYEMLFYLVFAAAMTLPRPAGLGAVAFALIALVTLGASLAPTNAALQVWTDPLLLEFLMGGSVAMVREAGVALGRPSGLILAAAGVALAIASGPAFSLVPGPAWISEGSAATLVLAGLALGPPWRPTKPLLLAGLLGDASYSLYLSHPFVIRPIREAWRLMFPKAPIIGYTAAACLAAVVASLLLYRFVERPITRALRRRLDAAPARQDTAADAAHAARP